MSGSTNNIVIAHQKREVRQELFKTINSNMDVENIDLTSDPVKVFEESNKKKTDIILLGSHFDQISGLDILYQIMTHNPKPVLMITEGTERDNEETVRAFSYGAIDFISTDLGEKEVIKMIEMASTKKFQNMIEGMENKVKLPDFSDKIIMIGSSTGGPTEVQKIVTNLDKDFPAPVIVVQHMSEEVTSLFAERMNKLSDLEIRQAKDEEKLEKGNIWIAPGNKDVEVNRHDEDFYLEVKEPIEDPTPNIDRAFISAAEAYGANTIGVILSGMGKDGAIGARFIKSKKGTVLIQNQKTSDVYGMGKHVEVQGDADEILPTKKIPENIAERV